MSDEGRRDAPWTVAAVLDWTRGHFAKSGSETARLDAEVLLAHALGTTRIALYTHHDRPLTEGERAAMRELVARRNAGEPVAYLTGLREFWSLDFHVDRRVLIPRPDSEILVEECLGLFRARSEGETVSPPERVAEVATGSGAIATVLAKELPGEPSVVAGDISGEALAVARENTARHGLTDRVQLVEADLLDHPAFAGPFDLIAANLPYIRSADLAGLPKDVRDFEPLGALDGGEDGLALVRSCVEQAAARLAPGAALVLEIGDQQQADAVAAFAEGLGAYRLVRVREDYGGRARVVTLRRLPPQ